MSVYNNIRACLDNHLATMPSVPPIAQANVAYNPTNGTTFVKATFNPTSKRPAVRGLNPQKRYQGSYEILICTPEGLGSGAGYTLADTITDRFDAATDISFSGTIVPLEYSEVGTSYLDSPFYCTPVSVVWYHYNS
jgi:hypothetical protein